MMIKAAVLGATGYAGIELVRLLTNHPDVSIEILGSQSFDGQNISDVYPNLKGVLDKKCEKVDIDAVAKCDVAFTALPHGASKEVIPSIIEKGVKVIDLSGDFRYDDIEVYEKWYGQKHSSPELLKESVYGMPELYRDKIKGARLIGNPGCYTTCSILGAYPLLKSGIGSSENIIIDAKSGVTGAGRGLSQQVHFCECTENMKAYKVATHRHTSEIEQELSHAAEKPVMVSFTVSADGRLLFGGSIEEAVSTMEALGADAVGVNCSVGPEQLESTVRAMRSATKLPLIVKPNAGMPRMDELGQAHYDMTAEAFAEAMEILIARGAKLIGGCCGTDPETILALRRFKAAPPNCAVIP